MAGYELTEKKVLGVSDIPPWDACKDEADHHVWHQLHDMHLLLMLGVHWASASWCQFAPKIIRLARSGSLWHRINVRSACVAKWNKLGAIWRAPNATRLAPKCCASLRQFAPLHGHSYQFLRAPFGRSTDPRAFYIAWHIVKFSTSFYTFLYH